MNVNLTSEHNGSNMAKLIVKLIFLSKIQELQEEDLELLSRLELVKSGQKTNFHIGDDGCLFYWDRLCVPNDSGPKQELMNKAHNNFYLIHLGCNKMYNNLKQHYWWLGMKREISMFVSKYLICQQVKAEHQFMSALLQPVMTPEWKWERITMDFVLGLLLTANRKDSIWVIVDRLIKSSHFIHVRCNY